MSFDPVDYDRALANVQDGHGREEFAPTSEQKLGRFTIVSLHLNRSIGSGIFVTPAIIEGHRQRRSFTVIVDRRGRHRYLGSAGLARIRPIRPSPTSPRWKQEKRAPAGWGEELCMDAVCLRFVEMTH
jgi:hypothetical protein